MGNLSINSLSRGDIGGVSEPFSSNPQIDQAVKNFVQAIHDRDPQKIKGSLDQLKQLGGSADRVNDGGSSSDGVAAALKKAFAQVPGLEGIFKQIVGSVQPGNQGARP